MRPMPPLFIALVLLAACGGQETTIKGTIREHPFDKAAPLARGSISILRADGTFFATDETNRDGAFKVQAPAGEGIYAVISGTGMLDASFRGIAGLDTPMNVPDGTLFGVPEWLRDEWETSFKGCPGFAIGSSSYVVGQVGLFESYDPQTGAYDTIGSATVSIQPGVSPDAVDTDVATLDPLPACYLDEAGLAYDAEATQTGPSGWFAVGGVPEGHSTLVITFPVTGDLESRTVYPLWMPAGGVVPRLPAWVELP